MTQRNNGLCAASADFLDHWLRKLRSARGKLKDI
jgi:hypothetical protein